MAQGAVFGSAGTINGNVTVAGTLSPGASPGTMTVNGNVALVGTSVSVFEITPTVSDKLVVNGNLAIAQGATPDCGRPGCRAGSVAGSHHSQRRDHRQLVHHHQARIAVRLCRPARRHDLPPRPIPQQYELQQPGARRDRLRQRRAGERHSKRCLRGSHALPGDGFGHYLSGSLRAVDPRGLCLCRTDRGRTGP
ncbi:hypothetical protein NOVOSPHI9U_420478 [Novosphingobium sp. 9U]|nr:hypothetical protein NOVOSPHI9U_420478 [Novosphingobium sp. 9U]